jgi:hypothetical protein
MSLAVKIALLVVFILVLGYLGFSYYLYGRSPWLYKLVMPGTYTIHCEKGWQTGWYYWRWKSKNVETSPHTISISITDEHKNSVPSRRGVPGKNQLTDQDRTGVPQFQFEVHQPGNYEITCTDKCVLVVVPTQSEYDNSELERDYTGSQDDDSFLPAQPVSVQSTTRLEKMELNLGSRKPPLQLR